MKTPLTILSISLLCTISLWADSPPETAREPAHPAKNRHGETRMLHHLLQMEQEELVKLRQTIERIEQMTPEEKELLSERIGRLEKMKPGKVEAMRQHFKAIDPEVRDAMRQRWLEMTPEARQQWRQKLRKMPPEARAKVFEEHGFLPSPGKSSKRKNPPRPPEE